MSKAETRGGDSALPVGQTKRGFSNEDSTNPKTTSTFMSIPTPGGAEVVTNSGVGVQSLTAGYPSEDSVSTEKDGDTYLPGDDYINRSYAFIDDGQTPDVGGVENTTGGRMRPIGVPSIPDPTNGIPGYDNSGAGSGTSQGPYGPQD